MLLHLLRGHPYFYCADASTFATFTARTSYFYCANTPTFTARTLSPTCTVRLCVRTLLLLLRGRSYLRYLYNCTVQTLLLLLCAAVFTISRYQSGITTFLIEIGLVWESGMEKWYCHILIVPATPILIVQILSSCCVAPGAILEEKKWYDGYIFAALVDTNKNLHVRHQVRQGHRHDEVDGAEVLQGNRRQLCRRRHSCSKSARLSTCTTVGAGAR